jgi:hypothetical protein
VASRAAPDRPQSAVLSKMSVDSQRNGGGECHE